MMNDIGWSFVILILMNMALGQDCPSGTLEVPGRQYCIYFTEKLSFDEAMSHCRDFQGMLYQPIDIYDDQLIGALLQNYTNAHYAWIGGWETIDGSLEWATGGETGRRHQVFGIYPFCSQNPSGFAANLEKCVDSRGSTDPCDKYIDRMKCGMETVTSMSKNPERDERLVQAFVQSFHSYINPSFLNHSFGEECQQKFDQSVIPERLNEEDGSLSNDPKNACILLRGNGKWYLSDCETRMNAICLMTKTQSCPQGWSFLSFTNACYKMKSSEMSLSVDEADSSCLIDKGHLLTVASLPELISIIGMATNVMESDPGSGSFMTGLICMNGTLNWIDGQPLTFIPRMGGEMISRRKRDPSSLTDIQDTPLEEMVIAPSPSSIQCLGHEGNACSLKVMMDGSPMGYSFDCSSQITSNYFICKIQL